VGAAQLTLQPRELINCRRRSRGLRKKRGWKNGGNGNRDQPCKSVHQ